MKRILALVLVMSGLLTWTPAAQAQPPAIEVTSPQVVQIFFTSEGELNALVAALDVWEVHPEAGYAVAAVTPEERAWLLKAGFTFQVDPRYARHPATIPSYPCYRTINELNAQLDQWVAQYATLAELQTVGYSYEGRALRALSLTNRSQPGPKPTFFLMANIHGRELITPEIAMSFIQLLLKGYGVDPDLTWLLNYHRIVVLVSANPDGHVRNEPGEPWSWWRKNANPTHGCDSTYYGVDLNRNSSFHWGGPGASTDPCDFTYRGPSAASESETQAVQTFVSTLFPDQRGPELTDAAPLTATGLLITLHSYSNLVLWPWGDTYSPAPNQVSLQQLGRKLAGFNGYTAQQASALYPTSGATDDWSYGELGLASYTFEVGSDEDGFYPSCGRYDDLVQPNVAALRYAAKVARAPYLLSAGPETLAPTVTPTTTVGGAPVTLTATLNDHFNGDQAIAAAEVYVDTPPWITTTTPITFSLTAVGWNVEQQRGDGSGCVAGRFDLWTPHALRAGAGRGGQLGTGLGGLGLAGDPPGRFDPYSLGLGGGIGSTVDVDVASDQCRLPGDRDGGQQHVAG